MNCDENVEFCEELLLLYKGIMALNMIMIIVSVSLYEN